MKQVFLARDPTEAHLVRAMLESHGVTATVRGEDPWAYHGEVPPPDAQPGVWITDDGQEDQARLLVEGYRSGMTPPAKATTGRPCHRCGEPLEPQFTACWSCGAERPIGGVD
jgi:hypothetical protein